MSHHEYGYNNHKSHDDYPRTSYAGYRIHDYKQNVLSRIAGNPKLRRLIVIGGILAIAVIVLLVMLLFPLILKLFGFVTENGLQGIIDNIWKGTK